MVLADGTIARAGGKVIKNVAGYDLAKLLAGSFGTLGLILRVSVRLHPLRERVTLRLDAGTPDELGALAAKLAHANLEMEALDVRWSSGSGAVLARFAGAAASDQAKAAAKLAGEGEPVEDDAAVWAEQRSLQRLPDGVVVRVAGVQTQLPELAREAERLNGTLVGRAALGVSWLAFEGLDEDGAAAAVGELRHRLEPFPVRGARRAGDGPPGA